MISTLKMAAGVLVNPIPTFAAIRDNDQRHFPYALCITAILYGLFVLTNIRDPVTGIIGLGEANSVILLIGGALGTLAHIIFLVAAFLLGKAWGGNQHWRKVFAVILYTGVAMIIPSTVGVIETHTGYDPVVATVSQILGTVFGMWAIVVTLIAIKTVNGFSIWKSIGVGLAAATVTSVVIVPLIVLALVPLIVGTGAFEEIVGTMFDMR